MIEVWQRGFVQGSFGLAQSLHAMTTGKRFAKRTNDHSDERVLDTRAKALLNALCSEPRGRALEGYLRAMGKRVA